MKKEYQEIINKFMEIIYTAADIGKIEDVEEIWVEFDKNLVPNKRAVGVLNITSIKNNSVSVYFDEELTPIYAEIQVDLLKKESEG